MKKFKFWLLTALAVGVLGIGAYSARTDIVAYSGSGSLRNIDVFRIDSNGDMILTNSSSITGFGVDSATGEIDVYSGDLNLGTGDTQPSTTAGTYPGILVPIKNGSGTAWTEGDVIISSGNTNTTAGIGSMAAVLATTTVLGVAAESIADGAVGFMRVSGWALVKTTGTVNIGDILVTTGTVAGRAGVTTGTQVVGTMIGKAVDQGTAAGDTVLTLLSR